jgi:hypothetical protein
LEDAVELTAQSPIRTVTDFVAVFLDRTAAAMGVQSAVRHAADAVRDRPGGDRLAAIVDGAMRNGWTPTVEALGQLGSEWSSAVLVSLATALRSAESLHKPMQAYLLACAQAEATQWA